jgi:predicted TIM-barrel fold metal-dependent hydrolase
MASSFVVDPLGLELIDKIGVDRVMWSTDYPHNESTFGYSRSSLKQAVDLVGPKATPQVVGGNVKRFLGI